jgi:hypothetical protein
MSRQNRSNIANTGHTRREPSGYATCVNVFRLGLVLALSMVIATSCASDPPVLPTGGVTATATATIQPPNPLASEIAGDGTFHVGTDIAPGTYHTDGPRTYNPQRYNNGDVITIQPTPCTWGIGRVGSSGGEANFRREGGLPPAQDWGPRDVVIPAGNFDFLSFHCRTWHLVKPG